MNILNKIVANIKHLQKISSKILIAITLFLSLNLPVFAKNSKELSIYEIEAKIIINLLPYIYFYEKYNKINLCIIGNNPLISYFDNLKNDKIISFRVIKKNENDHLKDCHVISLNQNYNGYLERFLQKIDHSQTLTIANIDNFAKSGGMVEFTIRNNRVIITVNKNVLEKSSIRIDNSILSVVNLIK